MGDDAPTVEEMKALKEVFSKATEIVGVEQITVAAGSFDASHHRIKNSKIQIDRWTIEPVKDLFIKLKNETGGILDFPMLTLELSTGI